MWNFKPNFKYSPLKFLGNPRPGLRCALVKLCQSLARVSRLGQVQTHMYYSVDSGPKFTGLVWLNAGGIVRDDVFPIFDILSRSGDIRDESRKLCKIDRKFSGGKNF